MLERISDTLSLGWVVTADLLCGLPQQTPAGVVYDVQTLLDAGIDGLSLYELEVHGYNRRWAAGQGLLDRTHVANYVAYQAAIRVMEAAGLRKNLFNHWAGPRDRNIYFTYPTRGEDCLAIGTIADGAFGDYHYRHPRYAPYLQAAWDGEPGLEGGLRRTPRETELLPVSTGILSGHLEPVLLSQIQAVQAVDGASLLDRWLACGLLTESHDGSCALTGSGSWFAGSMVQEWVTAPIYA